MRRTSEEAATPEFRIRVLPLRKTLQQFTLENLLATGTVVTVKQACQTFHACSGSTLRQLPFCRNRKLPVLCAKTVDDRISLWKLQEKARAMLQLPNLSGENDGRR
jgi:hypothetical protein